jgi:hypothetical protein
VQTARVSEVLTILPGPARGIGAALWTRPYERLALTCTWPAFIRTDLAPLAGTDFFTAEVLTLRGLVTYYVLFFIHLESRRVDIAGITIHPDEPWMRQIARNWMRHPARLSLSPARSGHQIHLVVFTPINELMLMNE